MTATPRVVAPLVIASNRGPVELRAGPGDHVVQHRGSGGLIAVLGPAAAAARGLWVASAITEHDIRAAHRADTGTMEIVDLPEGSVRVRMIAHEPSVYHDYYRTVSTELLWFLQHHLFDLSRGPVVDSRLRGAWCNYRRANNDIALACATHTCAHGTVLLQDYHLSLAPRRLRSLRPDVRSAHFTMTPWADPDYFSVLPRDLRHELVSGLLGADMVCFLVPRWARAFLECCARLGLTADPHRSEVLDEEGRNVAVRCFPVGVDDVELLARAARPEVAEYRDRLRDRVGNRQLVLRIDRMEPAKNILRGLAAYAELLEREPERRGQVVHVVHAYSSRGDLPAYRRYGEEVHESADRVNARFGDHSWQPVILETSNDFLLGLAAMSLADVLVVNPIRDGMNLVAKEAAVLSRRDLALVLSRSAGAADDLADGCVLVDPFDVTELSTQLAAALDLPAGERRARLSRLRQGAVALPPRTWLDAVLHELDVLRGSSSPSNPLLRSERCPDSARVAGAQAGDALP